MTTDPFDAVDDDLEAARLEREQAWRRLAIKDTPEHRAAYDAISHQVDDLLDMRHQLKASATP